ncbi:MAG: FecR domain-containing protein [Planctomycetes bacterium]|nr:FecR domain-containing protein [Planctomycetota bacterium]
MKTSFIFLCLLLLLPAGLFAAPESKPFGMITRIEGSVTISRNLKKIKFVVGDPLFEKDKISTGDDGTLEIRLGEENNMLVSPSSSLTLREKRTESGKNFIKLDMPSGAIRSQLNKFQNSKFEIITPVAVVGVRGTDFVTAFNPGAPPGQAFTVSVLKGSVEVGALKAALGAASSIVVGGSQKMNISLTGQMQKVVKMEKNEIQSIEKQHSIVAPKVTPTEKKEKGKSESKGKEKKSGKDEKKVAKEKKDGKGEDGDKAEEEKSEKEQVDGEEETPAEEEATEGEEAPAEEEATEGEEAPAEEEATEGEEAPAEEESAAKEDAPASEDQATEAAPADEPTTEEPTAEEAPKTASPTASEAPAETPTSPTAETPAITVGGASSNYVDQQFDNFDAQIDLGGLNTSASEVPTENINDISNEVSNSVLDESIKETIQETQKEAEIIRLRIRLELEN